MHMFSMMTSSSVMTKEDYLFLLPVSSAGVSFLYLCPRSAHSLFLKKDPDIQTTTKMKLLSSFRLPWSQQLLLSAVLFFPIISVFVQAFSPQQARASRRGDDPAVALNDRRHVLTTLVGSAFVWRLLPNQPAWAGITDETDTFANNWWTAKDGASPITSPTGGASSTPSSSSQQPSQPSDEVTIRFARADLSSSGLGLELADIEFRTNRRVYVKSVRPGSLSEKLGIQTDWIVVSLNGQSTERTNAQGVALMLKTALSQQQQQSLSDKDELMTFVFRDPRVFRNELQNLGSTNGGVTSTQVAPAGDTSQRNADGSIRPGRVETRQTDQTITVKQLVAPRMCNRGATTDDLLEISYLGTILETGQVFDGSAIKINGQAIPGRGDDVTLFFVLGKQPFGQFPPGWDTGMFGMCVGERRRLILPPVLAYGATGMPRRGIPPNATLQYDITLVSLNGLATPQ